jgi:branched-subunit amino acid aminotransferase/4-amino-4-deoxychorismate lyase
MSRFLWSDTLKLDFSIRKGIVAINGEISPVEKAKVSVLDRGFLLGDGVFETILSSFTKSHDLMLHLERLKLSCAVARIEFPWKMTDIISEINSLLAINSWKRTYIRIMITRGLGFGLEAKDKFPNKYIFVLPCPLLKESSLRLKLVYNPRQPYKNYPKDLGYLFAITQIKLAKEQGFDDVLFFNEKGCVSESSVSNIFFVKKTATTEEIITPKLSSGILSGITRKKIIDLCLKHKIKCRQSFVKVSFLPSFSEAFISSSLRGVARVEKVGEYNYQKKEENSLYQRIRKLLEQTKL